MQKTNQFAWTPELCEQARNAAWRWVNHTYNFLRRFGQKPDAETQKSCLVVYWDGSGLVAVSQSTRGRVELFIKENQLTKSKTKVFDFSAIDITENFYFKAVA